MSKVAMTLTILVLVTGCTKVYNNNKDSSPAGPTPLPTITALKIEYRVLGNAISAKIRYSTEVDGLTQTVTTLPFFTSFLTKESALFLSLEVTPISFPGIDFPFLSAQIYADGKLFREATSSSPILNTLSVNGNWRR